MHLAEFPPALSRRAGLRHGCALLLLATACLAHAARPVVSESLAITGAVKTPLTLPLADLQAFAGEQVEQTTTRHVDGKDQPTTIRGVRLVALLDKATLADKDHDDWKHAVVVASGTDGYSVAFSWPELFDTAVGPGVLVIFERDGKPLEDREGRIALVSTQDVRPGPRNVHWLARIDVRILAP